MSTSFHGEPTTAQLIADLLQMKEDEITVSIVNVQLQDHSIASKKAAGLPHNSIGK